MEIIANSDKELRDLNAYIDLICSTEIKTRHWYSYGISVAIIIVLFLYGILLKSSLQSVKRAYFLLHEKPLKEFDDMVLKKRNVKASKLLTNVIEELTWYMVKKFVVSILLLATTIPLVTLKYTIAGVRDLFLPFENECGPDLVSKFPTSN